jgi:hypothetical protein
LNSSLRFGRTHSAILDSTKTSFNRMGSFGARFIADCNPFSRREKPAEGRIRLVNSPPRRVVGGFVLSPRVGFVLSPGGFGFVLPLRLGFVLSSGGFGFALPPRLGFFRRSICLRELGSFCRRWLASQDGPEFEFPVSIPPNRFRNSQSYKALLLKNGFVRRSICLRELGSFCRRVLGSFCFRGSACPEIPLPSGFLLPPGVIAAGRMRAGNSPSRRIVVGFVLSTSVLGSFCLRQSASFCRIGGIL